MMVKMQQNLEQLKAGLSFEEYVPCDDDDDDDDINE